MLKLLLHHAHLCRNCQTHMAASQPLSSLEDSALVQPLLFCVSQNQKPDSSRSSQIPVYYQLFQHTLSGLKQKLLPAAELFP